MCSMTSRCGFAGRFPPVSLWRDTRCITSTNGPIAESDDPAPRPVRGRFSSEYELRIVAEYDAGPTGEKGAILRRERLYYPHVIEWGCAGRRCDGHLIDKRTSPARSEKAAEQAELEHLRKKVTRLEKDAALELLGKAHAVLELLSESADRRARPSRSPTDELLPFLERELSTTATCRLTGRSRATHYRRLNPPAPKERLPAPASALSSAECARVVALLNRPEYADLPPAQVGARELDEGRYWYPSARCTGSCPPPGRAASGAAWPPIRPRPCRN